jgi:hypothetical protein
MVFDEQILQLEVGIEFDTYFLTVSCQFCDGHICKEIGSVEP